MDPPPPPAATSSNGANKLRLMCSHGGHFLPRPRTNTLFYAGGETRIVSFHRHNLATISSFTSHISATLSVAPPFNIKYHLPPHLHLDSLISLSSDDDLAVLLDENRRLNSTPYRIRLFLFFFHSSPRSAAAIRHPKTEAWFFDALKSAKIMERDAHVTSQEFCSSAAESMVLDTTSSFGSTSSSTSSTNLPPLRAQADENNNNDVVLKDSKGKLNSSDSISCDNTVSSSVMSHQLNISYEDPAVYHISEARTNAESIEAENKFAYISSGVMANNMNMDLGYASFPQYNQVGSPHLQFVQAPQQILPIHPSGLLPLPSCQPMYQQPQPLQNMVYYPNQSCAVYLVPIGNIAPNGFPIAASGKASLNLNPDPPLMNVHVAYKPMGEARSPFGHDFAPPDYLTDNAMTASSTHVTQQQDMDIYSFYHQSPNVSINSGESPEFENELDDGLARDQIYKSQPPPPKYPTMSKATTNLLSEALAKLHVDNLKQQTEQ
ncbi:hypothetical protein HN51_071243 [Arachis hypogaea]|uniref:PB1 domain-containing protein n=1 Tax=Arachis hypogaea TaxID=3818 RepID=A0A444YYU9_ARAHY|nr:uncharacterized protein LOC107644557 [Arachis ipaensis]XP_025656375.1 uncharacterized protein LOC112751443 [Arachis hypogaea]QHO13822.1 uncharacterized protein DS421_15g518790 [Arachis hypogaea]RYR07119.1 hypothetical protein Ahy_B05g074439 [Arachis hypogaea]